MVQTIAATAAAITKIQAFARGNNDRKRVESHIAKVIDAMMAGQEPPPFPSAPHPKPPHDNKTPKPLTNSPFYSSGDDDDDVDDEIDETSVEEEIIVVLDDSYTDHTRDEIMAEFVTYSDVPPQVALPPSPKKESSPKKLSPFELYNTQLKTSVAKPKKAPWEKPSTTLNEEEPTVTAEPPQEKETVTEEPPKVHGWQGKLKRKLSWKKPKVSPAVTAVPEQASEEKAATQENSLESEKPKSASSDLNSSSHHIRKGAQGWWGAKSKPNATTESKPDVVVEQSAEFETPLAPAIQPQSSTTLISKESEHTTASFAAESQDDYLEPAKPMSTSSSLGSGSSHHLNKVAQGWWGGGKPKSKAIAESQPDVLIEQSESSMSERDSTKPKAVTSALQSLEAPDETAESTTVKSSKQESTKRSKVALPKWLASKKDDSSQLESTEPSAEKPMVKRSKVALPSWMKKEQPSASTMEVSEEIDESTQEEATKPSAEDIKTRDPSLELPKSLNKSELHEESKETNESMQAESTKEEPPKPNLRARRPSVVMPKWISKRELNEESSDESTPEEKSPAIKRSPVALPKWLVKKELPSAPNLEASDDENESAPKKPILNPSPVVLPKWLAKKELPLSPDFEASESEEMDDSAAFNVEKPMVKRNKVALPPWVKKASEETEKPEAMAESLPARPRWKKPEAKGKAPPAKSSPVESLETLQAVIPQESTETIPDTSAQTADLGDPSSDHKNDFAIPWLKPATPNPSDRESSERGSSPPPPIRTRSPIKTNSPHAAKSKLVNRYLSSLDLEDSSEHERRMAQIEADRARGRWDGTDYTRGGEGDGDESNDKKNWKYLQPKGPENKFDEGAAIKLQALVRGVIARRRTAEYVESLIEEIMRKLNAAREEDMAKRRQEDEEERRKQEEEAERLRKERDEERRRKEEEEIRRKMFDPRYGLPLWWLELIPHNTMSQEDYEAIMKKDNGALVVDYKVPRRDGEPLEAVSEEETEIDDENDANLDKILWNPPPTETNTTKVKRKSSLFSCFDIDAVEGVEPFSCIDNGHTTAPNMTPDINKESYDEKEDTERAPDPEQPESAPPAVTKIWM